MLNKKYFEKTGRRIVLGLALTTILCLLQTGPLVYGQATATLSGTVYDQSQAAVSGAQIELRNEASGDVRSSVSNHEGFFTITAIQPGSYTATISAPGFKTW